MRLSCPVLFWFSPSRPGLSCSALPVLFCPQLWKQQREAAQLRLSPEAAEVELPLTCFLKLPEDPEAEPSGSGTGSCQSSVALVCHQDLALRMVVSKRCTKPYFQSSPKSLSGVKVWSLWQPIHVWQWCFRLPELLFHSLSLMSPGFLEICLCYQGRKITHNIDGRTWSFSKFTWTHSLSTFCCWPSTWPTASTSDRCTAPINGLLSRPSPRWESLGCAAEGFAQCLDTAITNARSLWKMNATLDGKKSCNLAETYRHNATVNMCCIQSFRRSNKILECMTFCFLAVLGGVCW